MFDSGVLDVQDGLVAQVPLVSFRLLLLFHGTLGLFLYVLLRIP